MKHRCVLILQPRARDTHTRARETERERGRERERASESLPPSFQGVPNAPAQAQCFPASVTERGIAREGAHPHRPLAAAAAAARSPATAARRRRRQAAAAPPVRHRPSGHPVLSALRSLQTRVVQSVHLPVGQSERERERERERDFVAAPVRRARLQPRTASPASPIPPRQQHCSRLPTLSDLPGLSLGRSSLRALSDNSASKAKPFYI